MRRLVPILLCLLLSAPAAWAQAGVFLGGLPPSRLCRPALDLAERRHAIPARLLHAIARVESGRADPATGQVNPWPWTANAEGQGFYFDSKAQALTSIAAMQAKGVRSIDVGCMQVNLMHHPDAFASLDQAFDPMANADYAARFLRRLFDQTGSWDKAAAWYHSATPALGEAYQKRVMAVWPEEQKRPGAPGGALGAGGLAAAWGATIPGGHQTGRIIPAPTAAPGGGAVPPGRSLDAYRAAPITWAFQAPLPVPPAVAKPPNSAPRPSVHFLR